METIDYIFIFCCILGVCAIVVSIIHPFIPKDAMFESKEINIKRGKTIGSIIGAIVGLFMAVYLYENNFFGLFDWENKKTIYNFSIIDYHHFDSEIYTNEGLKNLSKNKLVSYLLLRRY